ncbi:MAG: type III-A CRISPR-associated RAMP protein Csm3 [Corynebacterium sp.]|nr:type III-A CRISPR-associated RAMP protein Csm3 [Corynebacterium sp.]
MFSKLEITGEITLVTGMHIGASDNFSAIGAIDSPVIKDILSGLPIIPGSSLKGKMRSLLARQYNDDPLTEYDNDNERIARLFGTSRDRKTKNPQRSRLIFADMIMSNLGDIKKQGVETATEAKEENSISRATGVANPRVLERTIRGAKFPLTIVYDADDMNQIEEDFAMIADGLRLLQFDYIGGHGSRGYGKISISDLRVEVVAGKNVDDAVIEKCNALVKEV